MWPHTLAVNFSPSPLKRNAARYRNLNNYVFAAFKLVRDELHRPDQVSNGTPQIGLPVAGVEPAKLRHTASKASQPYTY
jgi:hypothetical protein